MGGREAGHGGDGTGMTHDETIGAITGFLIGTGIPVETATLDEPGFLPGIVVGGGAPVHDPVQLEWPGDQLHEGGHIAVTEAEGRAAIAEVGDDPALEMASMAWSFAAACAIRLEPAIAFHADGYRGGGAGLAGRYATGFGPGTPMLARFGMTGEAGYPTMAGWLR